MHKRIFAGLLGGAIAIGGVSSPVAYAVNHDACISVSGTFIGSDETPPAGTGVCTFVFRGVVGYSGVAPLTITCPKTTGATTVTNTYTATGTGVLLDCDVGVTVSVSTGMGGVVSTGNSLTPTNDHGCISVSGLARIGGTTVVGTGGACSYAFVAGDIYSGVAPFMISCPKTTSTVTTTNTYSTTTTGGPVALVCDVGATVSVGTGTGGVAFAGNVI